MVLGTILIVTLMVSTATVVPNSNSETVLKNVSLNKKIKLIREKNEEIELKTVNNLIDKIIENLKTKLGTPRGKIQTKLLKIQFIDNEKIVLIEEKIEELEEKIGSNLVNYIEDKLKTELTSDEPGIWLQLITLIISLVIGAILGILT